MANKHQVLELLKLGFTTREVADRLNCTTGYVRATKQRASPSGMARNRLYHAWSYATNPKYREQKRAASRRYYVKKRMQRYENTAQSEAVS